ncbi:MAG: HIT family protein [Anaerolineales bacterium]
MTYIQSHRQEADCVFCVEAERPDGPENLIFYRGQQVYGILNRYPYTSGHLMIVPYAHQPALAGLNPLTRAELIELANQAVEVLQAVYNPQGFNVGINIGEAAGAGITEHVHMHVVPRWGGDTNFMSSLAQTRVLPETLEETYHKVRQTWQSLYGNT